MPDMMMGGYLVNSVANRETERQRDRGTEGQRDRERLGDRETERQGDAEAKRQSGEEIIRGKTRPRKKRQRGREGQTS